MIELKLNKNLLSFLFLYLPSSGCTAPTELGLSIRHGVEQIKANIFYSAFMDSFPATF